MSRRTYTDNLAAEAHKALMALPVDTPRPRLSERIRLSGKRLAQATRGWLTLNAEYMERERYAKVRNGPFPRIIPAAARPSTQSPPVPFESGYNCLPGMDQWADQVRRSQ